MAGRIARATQWMRSRIGKLYAYIRSDIRRRPFRNFYLALIVFVLIIVLSNILQTPPKTVTPENPPREVSLYSIGKAPKMNVQAQIEKTGVVKVVALSGGVVQKINFKEGDKVAKGSTMVNLSTNYQGGNAMSVQRQIANNQYKSALDTFNLQIDLINKQRDIATKSAENADKMRDLTNASRDRTRELIDLNKEFLDNVNQSIEDLESGTPVPTTAPSSTTESMIAAAKAQKAQLLAGLAQAEGSLASMDYQSDSNRPPAELARFQKDMTLKQLELQEKMLDVNKEASRLQLQLAQVTEALMYPSAPISGVVQRIFVHVGDVVSPGEQLAVIVQAADEDPITAIAYVSADIAGKISKTEESILTIGSSKQKAFPYFISTEAVSGNLYAVYYSVPDNLADKLTDEGYIDIEIPIGYADSTASVTYVPVDAVYQTETDAYLFIADKEKVKSRKITLGNVYGSYVAVEKGLKDGDQVILTRNVVEGDKVTILK